MKAGRTARPARPRSSTLSYLPVRPISMKMRVRMARRRSEEDAEAWYRKEKKLGEPGPLDAWLAARLARTQLQTQGMATRGAERPFTAQAGDGEGKGSSSWGDEVWCTVQVQCIKVGLGLESRPSTASVSVHAPQVPS